MTDTSRACHNGYMDPNQPPTASPAQPTQQAGQVYPEEPPQTSLPNNPQNPTKKNFFSKKMLLISGGVILLIITLVLGILSASLQNKKQEQQTITDTETPQVQEKTIPDKTTGDEKKIPNYYFVYGTWTGQTSAIRAFDLRNNKTFQIATLPLNIRKISLLNNETLLYIDQTDDKDNGRRISIYNIKDKSITTSIYAENNNTIYDYFLSLDKKYLVLWEIKKIMDKEDIFDTGKSQIFTVDITNASIKNIVYDEIIKPNVPVHYPRGITNTGTVITDSYLPDASTLTPKNFGYGLSMVDLDGTNKKDIDAVPDGTYGIKPVLGGDGKYLLFAGYDGSQDDGKNVVNGRRQAIQTPNTLELLNTQTLRRFPLPNTDKHIYTRVAWDPVTGNVAAEIQSASVQDTQTIIYTMESQSPAIFSLPQEDDKQYRYISQLPEGKLLMGIPDKRPSSLGNLGNDYEYAYANIAIKDKNDKLTKITIKDHFLQYITVLPKDFFKSELREATY